MNRCVTLLVALAFSLTFPGRADEPKPARKKIVILAGKKSHGPVGNGIHDYGWSARLLKAMLEQSNVKDRVTVETHLAGWPEDPRTLETANAIMVISDGRDGNAYEEAPHLASAERVRYMDGLMKKGCGFLTFHFSTFAPEKYRDEILRWNGGYFQWETDGKRQWFSAIKTQETKVKLGSDDHPILRGVKPFSMREEFYYNLRFKPKDESFKPILLVPSLEGRAPDGNIVAWARERDDGGRGFGTSCGHFYDNWKNDDFRKLILNAVVWAAKIDPPADGVSSRFLSHAEIDKLLGAVPGLTKPEPEKPIRALMFAGNGPHKWHNWEKTTVAIKAALEKDPRIKVDVTHDIEDLARRKLADYQLIVQNYVNWQDPTPLSDESKKAFVTFLKEGGGLLVIHFANGAYHPSLPKAEAADWPEYRAIVRRVWDHNSNPKSGHDAFGPFLVQVTKVKHPITDGLKDFDVTDELYYRQAGKEPIEPLLAARSRDTKQDEPLAFAYTYGKGRIFQTLLGHSEKTYDTFEPREILRRAAAWVSQREVRPLQRGQDR